MAALVDPVLGDLIELLVQRTRTRCALAAAKRESPCATSDLSVLTLEAELVEIESRVRRISA